MIEDPEYTRWRRKYPKFPGVAKCVELLGRQNFQGARFDYLFQDLLANAPDHIDELIEAFRAATDARVRRPLLEILSELGLLESLPLFAENIDSEDESLRFWAEQGLRKLDSPESRKILWEASQSQVE